MLNTFASRVVRGAALLSVAAAVIGAAHGSQPTGSAPKKRQYVIGLVAKSTSNPVFIAAQARDLSASLTTTAVSLDANVLDSTTVGADLRTLSDQLEKLRTSVSGTGAAPASDPAAAGTLIRVAMIVVLALLAWLAVPAIVAIEIGRRWRRAPDSRVDTAG